MKFAIIATILGLLSFNSFAAVKAENLNLGLVQSESLIKKIDHLLAQSDVASNPELTGCFQEDAKLISSIKAIYDGAISKTPAAASTYYSAYLDTSSTRNNSFDCLYKNRASLSTESDDLAREIHEGIGELGLTLVSSSIDSI